MSFRLRTAMAAAAAVAFAVLIGSASAYVVLRHSARQQVDDSLVREARRLRDTYHLGDGVAPAYDVPPSSAGGGAGAGGFEYRLLTEPDQVGPPGTEGPFAVTDAMRRVVSGERSTSWADVHVGGAHRRVLATSVAPGVALQVARDLSEVDRGMRSLAAVLTLVGVGGIAMGAGLGWWVARTATGPLVALTAAVERATATGDLTSAIPVTGQDELGRLGRRFNALLQSLDESLRSQRRLVADASHELRTPLTSLRTNVEVLTRTDAMTPADREHLVGDVLGQFEELSTLLGDLTELAREDEMAPALQEVRLDQLVEGVTRRMAMRARAADVRITTQTTPSLVMGSPSHLERATANLLDNALKWSPPGESVDVSVSGGEVTVRDHGPGIADDDLPLVFERFYRAPQGRDLPGSGLGLAIVRRIAENHGGEVWAERAPDGGARLRLRLSPVGRLAAPAPPPRRSGTSADRPDRAPSNVEGV